MNLNRRDFAKTTLGGLLAFLLPGKAKAQRTTRVYKGCTPGMSCVDPARLPCTFKEPEVKPEPKSKFPRFFASGRRQDPFVHIGGQPHVFVAKSARDVFQQFPDRQDARLSIIDRDRPKTSCVRAFTIRDAERHVARHYWYEITAAEAEVLLKPNLRRLVQDQRVWLDRQPKTATEIALIDSGLR